MSSLASPLPNGISLSQSSKQALVAAIGEVTQALQGDCGVHGGPPGTPRTSMATSGARAQGRPLPSRAAPAPPSVPPAMAPTSLSPGTASCSPSSLCPARPPPPTCPQLLVHSQPLEHPFTTQTPRPPPPPHCLHRSSYHTSSCSPPPKCEPQRVGR